jgi:hypothetical protein
MKKLIYILAFFTLINTDLFAQGCVALRHVSTNPNMGTATNLDANKWQISFGYRYFRSHRHFVGREYQEHRRKQGSEVMNVQSSIEITPTYAVNKRWSLSFTIPITYNDRSSLYEHDRVHRYHTYSQGLGDIRVMANYWLYNPETYMNSNISLGIGVKLPTGNSNVKDDFHRAEGIQHLAVDQSIQLGDGGVGIILEMQSYRKLFSNAYGYLGGFYLINPRETNNTLRGTSTTKLAVADQYMVRGGVNYYVLPHSGLVASLGGRAECVTVRDLFGGTEGFRRPGYIISVEPGATYMYKKNILNVSVPVAFIRNRTKSLADIKSGGHGDAAFADYVIYATYTRRF